MKSIYLLFALLILASCGSKDATSVDTSFVFTSGLSALDSQSGGIILYGRNKNDSNDIFSFVVGRDGEKLELTNGTWEFMAVSWNGYNSNLGTFGNKFEGEVRCSLIDNKVLEGGDVELTIVLNQATCSDTVFGLSDTKNSGIPKTTKIKSCSNVDYFKEGSSDDEDCYRSVGGSFQSVLMLKDESGKLRETMRSRCIVNDSTVKTAGELNSVAEHDLRLPIFFPYDVAPVWSIEVFEGADCSKQISKSTFMHPYAEEITGSLGSFDSDTENAFIVYSPVCNTNLGASATPFEAYKGSATTKVTSYHVLCNKEQFKNYIGTDSGTLSKVYRLGRDINFEGEVFSESIVPGTFLGRLNGDDHTISNFTIDASNSVASGKGLFSEVMSAMIYNVKLDSISIQCSNTTMVGALAGHLDYSAIFNISVSNIDIDNNECGSIGAIVGQADNMSGNAYGIHAESVSMQLSGEVAPNIGGGFGSYFGNLSNSTFRNIAIIPMTSPIALVNNYGGAIGLLENGDSVSNIMVENIQIGSSSNLLDYAVNVGLFAGRIYNSQSVGNIKVSGEIYSNTNAFQVGGVAGEIEVSGGISVSNLLSNVNIHSLGSKTGGIFGYATDTNNIKLLRSFGQITCTSQCGGIAGSSNSSNYSFLYSDVNLSASSNTSISDVGGLFGIINGATSVAGGQNDGNVLFPSAQSTSSIIGGIIGKYNSTGALSYLINHGDVHGRGAAIGGIIGSIHKESADLINFLNTGTIISDNNDSYFLVGEFNDQGGMPYYEGMNSGFYALAGSADSENSTGFPSIVSTNLTLAEASTLSTLSNFSPSFVEEYNSEPIQLSMVSRLKKMNAMGLLGNEKEPFMLTTPEQWNLIGDSEVFMSSHFSLNANLDFSGLNFISVGSEASPFSGGLKGNGFGFDNIEINTPAVVQLSGTVGIVTGSSHLLGTGTSFTSDLKAGDHIYVSGFPFVVASISSDTSLFVRAPHTSADVSGANFSIIPANNIGIFSKIEDAQINTPSNELDQYNEKLFIRNMQINMPETNGSTHVGALAGSAGFANSIQGIVVDNANISVSGSAADGIYVGGLIGNNEIISDEHMDWRYIDILNSSIQASGGDYFYAGGVFGRTYSSAAMSTEHQLKAIRVIDTELNAMGVGGIAYSASSATNVSLNFENILIASTSGHNFTATNGQAGGIFGTSEMLEVHNFAVKGMNIASTGMSSYIGGISGASSGDVFTGGYVKSNISIGEGMAGCLIGYTHTTYTAIENSYADCANVEILSSGVASYLVADTTKLNIAADNNVFYIAPSDESIGISGFNYILETNISNETFMAANFPNFFSGDPWFWNTSGSTPITVMEMYPQYFFQ